MGGILDMISLEILPKFFTDTLNSQEKTKNLFLTKME